MRPRHLELRAFGPFADAVRVDFDRLADSGLFVVAGPTGAGKTSLFDGVCFALYGRLAGHREHHAEVRSDHAAADQPTEVVLSFDAAGERWRVWRHPRQLRPKRRGSGTTTAAAQATLERWHGDRWEPVASRWEPVTQRCRELVGLDVDQFQQVVLLPQGRFQAVLNARSLERQELLRTLFRSQLFRRGQDVLDAQAKALADALGTAEGQRRAQLGAGADALSAAAGSLAGEGLAVPAGLTATVDSEDGGGPAALREAVLALRAGPVGVLDRRRQEAEQAAGAAAERANRAEGQLAAIARREELRAAWDELQAQRAQRETQAAEAAAARRALPVADATAQATSARRRLAEVEGRQGAAWEQALAACVQAGVALPLSPDQDAAEQARVEAEMQAKAMADLAVLLDTATALEAAAATAERDLAEVERRRHDLVERCATDGERLEQITAEREALLPLAAEVAGRAAALDDARRRVAAVDDLTAATAARDALVAERDAVDERLAVLDRRLADSGAQRDEARALAQGLAVATELAQRCRRRLAGRRALAAAQAALTASAADVDRARARADHAISRFVEGAAPRLAAHLRPGEPCPVCGSAEHPAPAARGSGATVVSWEHVERLSQEAAAAERRRVDDAAAVAAALADLGTHGSRPEAELAEDLARAERQLTACAGARRSLPGLQAAMVGLQDEQGELRRRRDELQRSLEQATARRSELVGRLGSGADDRDGLAAAVAGAAEDLDRARDAAASLDRLADERRRLQSRRAHDAQQVEQLVATAAELRSRIDEAVGRADHLRAEVRAEVGASPPGDLAERARQAARLVATARRAVAEREDAARAAADAVARRHAAVAAAGFPTLHAALDAVRVADDLERLEALVERWRRAVLQAGAELDAVRRQPLPEQAPDLPALQAAARTAADDANRLVRLAAHVEARLAHAEGCLRELDDIEARTGDLLARARLVQGAAEVVRGRNPRNTTLEAWVLAAHLRDVVEHANEHLAGMSGGRYRLAVAETVVDARARAGLDLLVEDAFTGTSRPTVSLSGGETFQASLSLALGLADVVTAGRAGLHLDALFIDEGFGSLDADALDQAIGVLDGLRSRGAIVGVVTHVESLKHALPVGIEVRPRPDRRGSTVHQAA